MVALASSIKRRVMKYPPTEADLHAQKRRLCNSAKVRAILNDPTVKQPPEELKLCVETSDKPGAVTHWQAAQKAFGWEAEKRLLEALEARIRIGAQLDAAYGYASKSSERERLKSDMAAYYKRLDDLNNTWACKHAGSENPVQRACDKVREDFTDLIDKIEQHAAAKGERERIQSESDAEAQVLQNLETAVDLWRANLGSDTTDLGVQIKASQDFIQDIRNKAKSLQDKLELQDNLIKSLRQTLDEDTSKMNRYLFNLINAAKADFNVQQGQWTEEGGGTLRWLEGNKVYKVATAADTGLKKGDWVYWEPAWDRWLPESKEKQLAKRGKWYDDTEKAFHYKFPGDDRLWKRDKKKPDIWLFYDEASSKWKKDV